MSREDREKYQKKDRWNDRLDKVFGIKREEPKFTKAQENKKLLIALYKIYRSLDVLDLWSNRKGKNF